MKCPYSIIIIMLIGTTQLAVAQLKKKDPWMGMGGGLLGLVMSEECE